jgi:hypothetical protein
MVIRKNLQECTTTGSGGYRKNILTSVTLRSDGNMVGLVLGNIPTIRMNW